MNRDWWQYVLALGDFGPYAWGAYLIALAVVIVELVLLRARRRNIERHLGDAKQASGGGGHAA